MHPKGHRGRCWGDSTRPGSSHQIGRKRRRGRREGEREVCRLNASYDKGEEIQGDRKTSRNPRHVHLRKGRQGI